MRHLRITILLSLILLPLCSCSSWKNFKYLQDASNFESLPISNAPELRVSKSDVLHIYVSSRNPESARPFNLMVSGSGSSGIDSQGSGANRALGYFVDEFGNIEFPQIGTIHCEGMSRTELATYIKCQLIDNDFLKDPIVTVEFQSPHVTVLGEVSSPGVYNMINNRISLVEALAMAGDLTVYGRRDKVAVIREIDGKRTIVYHDLRSKEIFNSPRYYLQQNDIVYVEPNRSKATQSDVNRWNQPSLWFSTLSTLMSIATFFKISF